PPIHTKTWFHTGAYLGGAELISQLQAEYYKGDALALALPAPALPDGLIGEEAREACRALKGRMLRQENFPHDKSGQSGDPYSVTDHTYMLVPVQPMLDDRHAVFFTYESETLSYHYERNPQDPRIAHEITLEVDDFGNVTKSATAGYPRRAP